MSKLLDLRDNEKVRAALNLRTPFHTRKTTGYYKHLAHLSGAYIAHAELERCENCGLFAAYKVYSYETLLYSTCSACEHEYTNMQFYSKSTRELQETLAGIFPACQERLHAQHEIESEAVALWKKDQKKGLVSTNRYLGINDFGQPRYSHSANLFEMLEHLHEGELPGHFIHNAD